jgi:hypothetical protein
MNKKQFIDEFCLIKIFDEEICSTWKQKDINYENM